MRGKFGLSVVLLALAAFVVSESQSFGGCHRRRGRCGSCATACAAGSCCDASMPAAPADASPSDAPPAPAAPAPAEGAAKSSSPEAPQTPSVASGQSRGTYYYASRRARRRGRR